MSTLLHSIGVSQHHWMQHNLPWLMLLAILVGLARDEDLPGVDDQRG